LFGQWIAGSVVFYAHDHERKIHRFFELILDIPYRVAKGWCSIREIYLQLHAWHYYDTDFDFAFVEAVSQMDNVTDQQVASSGHLELGAESNQESLVVPQLLLPVDSTGGCLHPASAARELFIYAPPQISGPIRVPFFFDVDGHGQDDILKLEEEIRETQTANLLSRSVIIA
jgi:hypothetical protein